MQIVLIFCTLNDIKKNKEIGIFETTIRPVRRKWWPIQKQCCRVLGRLNAFRNNVFVRFANVCKLILEQNRSAELIAVRVEKTDWG